MVTHVIVTSLSPSLPPFAPFLWPFSPAFPHFTPPPPSLGLSPPHFLISHLLPLSLSLLPGVVTLMREHKVCSDGDILSPEQARLLVSVHTDEEFGNETCTYSPYVEVTTRSQKWLYTSLVHVTVK